MDNPFYKTRKWQRLRESILKQSNNLCVNCLRFGKYEIATVVHHVVPISNDMRGCYDKNNLIGICNKCHESFHDRLQNDLTELGKYWVRKKKTRPVESQ